MQKPIYNQKKVDDVEDEKKTSGEQNPKPQPVNSEIEELTRKLEEMTNHWMRAVADYQNLEKRVVGERIEYIKFLSKNLIKKFLPVLDDLEKAEVYLKDKGLELALKKLHVVLESEGVKRMETQGKDYDVGSMEALSIDEGKEDNKVIEEYRAGYMIHGSVLRPAQVKVSKKK